MPKTSTEYGKAGRFGIGTPQANPTVEDEFNILFPPNVSLHSVRLTSLAEHAKDRLCEYIKELPDYLKRYDTLLLDAFGFACTASSYLIDEETEASILKKAATEFPIYTATQAIKWALHSHNAKRIVIAAPYPEYIREAAFNYWTRAGFDVADVIHIKTSSTTNTRTIYSLTSADAIAALEKMSFDGIDAVLLSGTGMPTLQAVALQWPVPVLSSNLCLAAKMIHGANTSAANQLEGVFIKGWQSRLEKAIQP